MSPSLSVIRPETILISDVKVCPVVIKSDVKFEISESLLVICVCKVCPVVTRLFVKEEMSESLEVI